MLGTPFHIVMSVKWIYSFSIKSLGSFIRGFMKLGCRCSMVTLGAVVITFFQYKKSLLGNSSAEERRRKDENCERKKEVNVISFLILSVKFVC